jgi:exopolysaccharide biosynthesis polyprenyl glycosylphosphotransferase
MQNSSLPRRTVRLSRNQRSQPIRIEEDEAMNLELGRIVAPAARSDRFHRRWQPRRMTLRIRLFAYTVLLDLLCLLVSFGVAPFVHGATWSNSHLQVVLGALVPTFLLAAWNIGAYSASLIQDRFAAISRGLQAFAFTIGFLLLTAFSLKASAHFSRLTLAIGIVLGILSLAAARFFFAKYAIPLIGGNPFSVVMLSDGDHHIVPSGDYSVMLAADADFDPNRHDPDMYDRLARVLESADRVVVLCDPDRRMAWASALKGANIQSEIVVPELDELAPLGVSRHGDVSTLIVSNGPLKLGDRVLKRVFDTSVAGLALIFFSPLFLVIASLIKLDSRGPVFFVQTRIGEGNRLFKVYKFRSMRSDMCDGDASRLTARDDDRVTRIGWFIRKTSIDELPQLINVLLGKMSIVGPRPHALGARAADKLYWEVDDRYWHRHAAKPGLTGLAQVRGYRGNTEQERDLTNRLQADLEYLTNWSIWKDLKIIIQTFRVLLHRNAY